MRWQRNIFLYSTSDQSMVITYGPLGCSLVCCGSHHNIFHSFISFFLNIPMYFEVAYLLSFQMFLMKGNATAKKIQTHCGPCPSWVHSVQITILSC